MVTDEEIERDDFDLYYHGTLIVFDNGEQLLVRDIIPYQSSQPDLYHKVIKGDTLTYLAWYYYQNFTEHPSRYWKYIADGNNSLFMNPMDLSGLVGTNILIPNFQLMKLAE